jgi:hypothetical protein
MAKSRLSNHFRVLREAGLIRTTKKGVEHQNTVREADINARFPGLLKSILKHAGDESARAAQSLALSLALSLSFTTASPQFFSGRPRAGVPSGMRLEFSGAFSGNMKVSFQAARSIG